MNMIPQRTVRTTCPYCGVGCGVLVEVTGDIVSVRGDPDHPANFGRLCSKGSALAETIGPEGRLLAPEIGGRPASWDEALDLVAARFGAAIAEHGPDAVAFYVSGQLLTEDYYVANKLMKGFIGSANIDTNSRLCMASAVAGQRRAFGADIVPATYRDLEEADLVVLVGSNLAWCHPVLFQRLMAAREAHGTRIVVVDPRRTATAEGADLHLPLAPGSDVALFSGLLDHLFSFGALDDAFVSAHTSGLDGALRAAQATGLRGAAAATGLDPSALLAFYELFAATEKVVTVFSQGVNQAEDGTDRVNAILNCHLLSGRIGRPGAGPFSVTGQPNAMGGREVGGLANQLAAHMEIEDPAARARLARFWGAERLAERPGLKAVDLFRAVAGGDIKALWIMATNPVDSMPDADLVRRALEACPFVVVSDVVRDSDTVAAADVLLPAAAWGEKDGTVTNSERRISRQRPFARPPGAARPDWWIVSQVAERMGFGSAFAYSHPAEIFAEHAALSAFENGGTRIFDLGGLAGLDRTAYDALAPVQWPVRPGEPAGGRLFGAGGFQTPDGRARFVATPPRPAPARREPRFPLVLNTGRVRDHWHTMTRTGRSPRLSAHIAEPFVEIHPDDAAEAGIAAARLVTVESARARIVARAFLTPAQQPGSVFVPMHWTDQNASAGRVDALVRGDTDPVSGQPALKASRVRIAPFPAAWYGFAVLRDRPERIPADYWAAARTKGGWRIELAGLAPPADWADWARLLLPGAPAEESLLAFHDSGSGRRRFAAFEGERLLASVHVAPEPVAVSRSFAAAALDRPCRDGADRLAILAGRAGGGRDDPGALVCACFGVGANDIARCLRSGAARDVETVGARLRAGTNCGSCRSEIQRIVDGHAFAPAL
ncbi:nitrate reductase [Propylenella binzhouense]|uniref:Nitrate reductase n=1 Tax=Propylenella binzhouense TaxID=2555902 RepID=A0A964WVE1_9HYPH|nr:nitrate reductase [Propylenella binzhouense]MYZ50137.1 nitrate reductase [Propylenella binzhouense]